MTGKVKEDSERFMTALNPALMWLEEQCDIDPDHWVATAEVWKNYKEWCSDGGHRALSRNRFFDQILQNCPTVIKKRRGRARTTAFIGLDIKSSPDDS